MVRFSNSKQKIIELKQKKKTLSEEVNEAFNSHPNGEHYGKVEEYVWSDDSREEEDEPYSTNDDDRTGKGKLTKKGTKAIPSITRLRRRGPLEESLSQGKYSGRVVDSEAVFDASLSSADEEDDDNDDDDEEEEEEEPEDLNYRYNKMNRKDKTKSSSSSQATPQHVEARMDALFSGLEFNENEIDEEANEEIYYDDDNEEDEEEDDDSRRKKGKKKVSVKDLSEEEYIQYLENKERRKRGRPGISFDTSLEEGEEGDEAMPVEANEEDEIIQQLKELQQNRLRLLKEEGEGEGDANSGRSKRGGTVAENTKSTAQQYLHLYAQLLAMRVRLQSSVNQSIQLPQYYARELFVVGSGKKRRRSQEEEEGEEEEEASRGLAQKIQHNYEIVSEGYKDLLSDFYHFATLLSNKKDTTTSSSPPPLKKKRLNISSYQSTILPFHQHVLESSKETLDYWGDKLLYYKKNNNNNNELQSISQKFSTQIENVIQSQKIRLSSKLQRNKQHRYIYGHPTHYRAALCDELYPSGNTTNHNNYNKEENEDGAQYPPKEVLEAAKQSRVQAILEGDIDEEIIHDQDFLLELVHHTASKHMERELLSGTGNGSSSSSSLNKKGEAPKRKGFHHLTKGKTINYAPRPKLVSFMMAEGFGDGEGGSGSGDRVSQRSEVLIQHLFQ